MKAVSARSAFATLPAFLLFSLLTLFVHAQTVQYSKTNVFIGYPSHLLLAGSINGKFHLISFINNEPPDLFIFNDQLQLEEELKMSVKYPERSTVKIIPGYKYYFILVSPPFDTKYLLWKIDGNGTVTDLSARLQDLISSRVPRSRVNFQIIPYQDKVFFLFHPSSNPFRNQTSILSLNDQMQLDSSVTRAFDIYLGEGQVQQETLVAGKDLYVLKTTNGGTSLVIMKADLTTGDILDYTYHSTHQYLQSSFTYNPLDSGVTLYSLLRGGNPGDVKNYVFISRHNKSLEESTPFSILKSQFLQNTNTNVLLTEEGFKSISLRSDLPVTYTERLLLPTNIFNDTIGRYRNGGQTSRMPQPYFSGVSNEAVRFSFISNKLKITSDSLFPNDKKAHIVEPGNVTGFRTGGKIYMLASQQFFNKSNGILMVNEGKDSQLEFTDVIVNNRNDYILTQSAKIPGGVIVPYIHKREAGLVKITIE